jgi:hypothetical protein
MLLLLCACGVYVLLIFLFYFTAPARTWFLCLLRSPLPFPPYLSAVNGAMFVTVLALSS